jgi:hypothetical protein
MVQWVWTGTGRTEKEKIDKSEIWMTQEGGANRMIWSQIAWVSNNTVGK